MAIEPPCSRVIKWTPTALGSGTIDFSPQTRFLMNFFFSEMRQTLRRSCAACAKLKHSCDLKLPRCSRCIKRKVLCVYANEPLAAPVPAESNRTLAIGPRMEEGCLSRYNVGSFDPFDSYPPTRLPREQVQRLIYSCMYYIFIWKKIPWIGRLIHSSPSQNSLSVLSAWSRANFKSIPHLVVATCSRRPCLIPCLITDSMSWWRKSRPERLPEFWDSHGWFCSPTAA